MAKKRTCYSGIGGQAVLEGVMMKNNDTYAVAVRKPDGSIDVENAEYHGVLHGMKITKTPFFRGIFNFLDSLILGMRALDHSASFYDTDVTKESAIDKGLKKTFGKKADTVFTIITITISLIMAIGLFMVLPFALSSMLNTYVRNDSVLVVLEGIIRLAIFLVYIVAITALSDIKRLYMYHGAEHKCINCLENGKELNVENVKKSSRYHKRCGTSFMLIVMLISIVVFLFIRVDSNIMRLVLRIALLPVIAGISYEIIRLAGRSDNVIVQIISAPGVLLQKLTTKEPDEDMIQVAISSIEAVFDWRGFLTDSLGNSNEQR